MNYTTIEQSKHLLELGLNPETADMWWSRCCIIDFNDGKGLSIGYSVQPVNLSESKNTDKDIPCWSVGALMGLLRPFNYHLTQDIKGDYVISTYFNAWVGYDLLDTLVNTIIWLLQNNYIKTKEK